jgi:hypothetical protein
VSVYNSTDIAIAYSPPLFPYRTEAKIVKLISVVVSRRHRTYFVTLIMARVPLDPSQPRVEDTYMHHHSFLWNVSDCTFLPPAAVATLSMCRNDIRLTGAAELSCRVEMKNTR